MLEHIATLVVIRIIAYVKVGRSLYSALNRMNCVKKGRVSLVVPMAIALPIVPTIATRRRTESSIETPLLIPPPTIGALEVSPCSFILFPTEELELRSSLCFAWMVFRVRGSFYT